ncbi:alpha/beta fold hydrolase [Palleronia sp.]|uniref:alpha/beta fold hydrolase n=1 Tax=Palleronia sp. TaxID=1940284 RepID=UPI0035C7B070
MTTPLEIHERGRGAPVVLLHGEGLDASIWDGLALPGRLLAVDLRGHGASEVTDPPYAMGALVRDVEAALGGRDVQDAVLVGHGLGGMIAQALAVKRLNLVRALVLTGSAAKRGTAAQWQAEAEAVARGGMEAVAKNRAVIWAPRRADPAPLRDRLLRCDPRGYRGACTAIAGTDLMAATATLRLPALVLAGTDDRVVPPDLARETASLIPGAEIALLSGAGHVAALDAPDDLSRRISDFLSRIGHFV